MSGSASRYASSPDRSPEEQAPANRPRMFRVTGHVFVVPGRLESLRCDDVLVSTDARADVGESWWPVFGWSDEEGRHKRRSFGTFPDGARVLRAEDGDREAVEPRRWLADVGGYAGKEVGWLLDGVREAL